jgi:ATP-binding cassette, subfamily B, multidrug efflux pump
MLARLLPSLAGQRRRLAVGLACVPVAALVGLMQPQVLRLAVDDLKSGVDAAKLGRYALLYFAIALTAGFVRYWMRWLVIGASRATEAAVRDRLFAHLQRLPASYFQRERAGEILSRCTNDLTAVRMMLGPGLMYALNTVCVAPMALGFMLHISPRLTLYTLLPLPLVSFVVWYVGDRIHHQFEGIQAQFADIAARVQESLAGVRVVRAFARERLELEEFQRMNRAYLDQSLALVRTSAALDPALAFLSGLAAVLALWLGGFEVVAGRISLGQFVAFIWYLGMLNWPMQALGWVVSLFQRGRASWRRILGILDAPVTIASAPGARRLGRARGAIEVRGLSFTYPGAGSPALRDVSFHVPAGGLVALVGGTGSGKSTLLSLLPRAFDPPPGTVFLDGHDVLTLDLADLRRNVGWVMQEPFLFSTTLAANIACGTGTADDGDVASAAARAGLAGDVADFPDGYATRVGERGITLSGGQRQRVAIARALVGGAPVLMLDDCLSSVDAVTEDRIITGLEAERGRRTLIVVSHRLRAVRDADLILVLEDGAVVERGTHDALLALGGRYARLVRRQRLEAELEAS